MNRFLKALICMVLELGFTIAGGAVGSWWPIRDVPKDQVWAGDGIGMMFFGLVGLVVGALLGVSAVLVFLSCVGRGARPAAAGTAPADGTTWPPPPNAPEASTSESGHGTHP